MRFFLVSCALAAANFKFLYLDGRLPFPPVLIIGVIVAAIGARLDRWRDRRRDQGEKPP